MSFSFPPNPEVGDKATNGNVTYTWDGTKWVSTNGPLVEGATGPIGATGATGPVGTFDGDTPIVSRAIVQTLSYVAAGIETVGLSTFVDDGGTVRYRGVGVGSDSVAIGPRDNYFRVGGTPGTRPEHANLMFNHFNGRPNVDGNSVRLSVNTSQQSQPARLDIAMSSNAAYGVTETLESVAYFEQDKVLIRPDTEFSGDISVDGEIFGNLTGNIDGDVSGNSGTTDKLRVPVNINLAGDVAGTASFDGSQSITISNTIQPNSVRLATDTTGDFVKNVTVSGVGLNVSGSGENATYNVSSNATSSNVVNTVVSRNSTGDFSANRIFAKVTGDVTGNADTASKWRTARTLSLSGDLGGSVSIDGSKNVTLSATVQPNSVELGTDTTGSYVEKGRTTGNGLSGSVDVERGEFVVSSNATPNNTPSTLVFRNSAGNFSAGTITANLTGNATNASLAADAVKSQKVTISASNSDTANSYVYFGGSSGAQTLKSDSRLRYRADLDRLQVRNILSDGTITANNIDASGTITGNVSGNSASASVLSPGRTINGVLFNGSTNITITAGTNEDLVPGSYIVGSRYDGLAETTWSINATSANTGGAIVARNGSGDFTARNVNVTNLLATAEVRSGNGSATNPSHTFRDDTDTGMGRIGANILGLTAGGAEIVRVDTNRMAVGESRDVHLRVGGTGTRNGTNIRIYQKVGDSDHIQFYSGTTRMGEIGAEGGSFLRINQETNKNIYTPRMFRADGGFQVDGAFVISATGVHEGNGSGLTNLNASRITTGTISKDRLPSSIDSNTGGNAATATRANTVDVSAPNNGSSYRVYFGGNGTGQTVNSDAGITVIPNDNRIRADWFQGSLDGRAEAAITLSPRTGPGDKTVVNTAGMYTDYNRAGNTGASYFINQSSNRSGGWYFSEATTSNVDTNVVRIHSDGRIQITGADKTFEGTTFTGNAATASNATLLDGKRDDQFLRSDISDVVTGDFIRWNDNKEIRLGTGNDLRLRHNGTDSFIDNYTRHLYIRSNVDNDDGGNIYIQAKSGENGIIVNDDSSVALYFNGTDNPATNKKFETTSTGGTLTGILVVTGTVNANLFSGSGASLTTLNASNLASGTVPSARLSGTYDITVNGTTTNATRVAINNGSNSGSERYIPFSTGTNGNYDLYSRSNFRFIPSTNTITSNISGTAAFATKVRVTLSDNVNNDNARLLMVANASPNSNRNDDVLINSKLRYQRSTNTLTADRFSGSGSLLTNLNANNISSGTLDKRRLPTNIDSNTSGKASTAGTADRANDINIDQTNNSTNYQVTFSPRNNTAYNKQLIPTNDNYFLYNPNTNILSGLNYSGNGSRLTSLSATNVTGGTLNGNNVSITNISASNITKGTLNKDRLPSSIDSNTTGNAATATRANSAANADNSTKSTVSSNGTGTLNYVLFANGTSGSRDIKTDSAFKYNATTDTLTVGKIEASNLNLNNGLNGGTIDGSQTTITNINASNITTGTINADRLPTNISSNTSGNAATATNASNSANADKLDNLDSDQFLRSDRDDSTNSGTTLTLNGLVRIRGNINLRDSQNLYFGNDNDINVYYNSNNWLYWNFKNSNGIIFQDNGSNRIRLEDSGIFRPEASTNTCTIGTLDRRWNQGFYKELDTNVLLIRNNARLYDNNTLRFGSGSTADAEFFCDGTHLNLRLNGSTNFYINDGNTRRFTFDDNGTFIATGAIKAGSGFQVGDVSVIDSNRKLTSGLVSGYDRVNAGGSITAINRSVRYLTSDNQVVTLPGGPSAGNEVVVAVGNYTNCRIARNGQRIMGIAEDLTIDQAFAGIRLIFIDSTRGWVVC